MMTFFSPGRINLIGEHIDYNGGLVLPAAINLGITLNIVDTPTNGFVFSSNIMPKKITINNFNQISYDKNYDWANYPIGVLAALTQKGIVVPTNKSFEYTSTLPVASGLSSSACIEVLTAYAAYSLSGKKDIEIDRKQLALLTQSVENNFIGVKCGIMDQFVIANAKPNMAMLLNCSTLEYENIPASFGSYKLLIINTNVPRTLANSGYNERREQCEQALHYLQKTQNKPFENLCQVPTSELKQSKLKEHNLTWFKRAKHAVTEQLRVIEAVEALKNNNLIQFGNLLNQSHQSLSQDYQVSCPELDFLVNKAQLYPQCLGARMMGAGFGGCAIALVHESKINSIIEFLNENYNQEFNKNAECYVAQITGGVSLVH
jgi:galactokinase